MSAVLRIEVIGARFVAMDRTAIVIEVSISESVGTERSSLVVKFV
jgi:hypothetical protein